MPTATTCPVCSSMIVASPEGRMPPWCPRCGADVKAAGARTSQGGICSSCSRPVVRGTDGRLPPWCQYCGASVSSGSATAPAPRPVPPASPAPIERAPADDAGVPTGEPASTASFFACIPSYSGHHDLYRVYVTDVDLLVFSLGKGPADIANIELRRDPLPPTPERDFGRDLANIALEAAIGVPHLPSPSRPDWIARLRDHALALRIEELEAADEAARRTHAELRDRGFVLASADCTWMTLDGPSTWYGWTCVKHEAVWSFQHRTVGRWKLLLGTTRDVRAAAKGMPRLFGRALSVRLSWGRSRSGADHGDGRISG